MHRLSLNNPWQNVENMKLDELKGLVRRCGTEFKARIRRRPKRAAVGAFALCLHCFSLSLLLLRRPRSPP